MLLRRLPSERYPSGSIRPEGFVDVPDTNHERRAADALAATAAAVSVPSRSSRTIAVTLCHYRHNHLLSPKLFGFAVYHFDSEGTWRDPFSEGEEVRYAITLNLPVELQREAALGFLFQLVLRQAADVAGSPDSAVDRLVASEDAKALHFVADQLRFGWKHAAAALVAKAASAGLALEVAYEPDPIPRRDDIVARFDHLRRMYNEIGDLRTVVDRVVSMVGGSGNRVMGGAGAVRDWLQWQSESLHWREYQNQTMRDAQVLGNGYMAFATEPTPTTYCLRPDRVTKLGPDSYSLQPDDRLLSHNVMHLRGIDQLESPYGLSALEPVMPSYVTQQMIAAAAVSAEEMLAAGTIAGTEAEPWARGVIELRSRTEAAFTDTLQDMFFLPLQHWTFEAGDLYFAGQDLLT